MLDMGFEPQVRALVEACGPGPRQTCLFSATFPKDIQALAKSLLTKPVWIGVGVIGAAVEVRGLFVCISV